MRSNGPRITSSIFLETTELSGFAPQEVFRSLIQGVSNRAESGVAPRVSAGYRITCSSCMKFRGLGSQSSLRETGYPVRFRIHYPVRAMLIREESTPGSPVGAVRDPLGPRFFRRHQDRVVPLSLLYQRHSFMELQPWRPPWVDCRLVPGRLGD